MDGLLIRNLNVNDIIDKYINSGEVMKSLRISLFLCLAIVAAFASFALADDLPELKFEKFELPNGLDVILHEDHSIP